MNPKNPVTRLCLPIGLQRNDARRFQDRRPFVEGRRWFGVFSLGLPALIIGALLVQGAITSLISTVILLVVAGVFGWSAYRMATVPAKGIVFDGKSLETEDGLVLAKMDEIVDVQTSIFAMKPTNGFTLILNSTSKMPTRPGIFWRQGRHMGVGGLLRASEAKSIGKAIQAEVVRPKP